MELKAPSSIMTNAIRKAYGIGRLAFEPERLFEPRFVASCLITATMPIHAGRNFWYPINKKPYDVEYSYLLRLNYPKRKWHIEGERRSHGIFALGQWRIVPQFFSSKDIKEKEREMLAHDFYWLLRDCLACPSKPVDTVQATESKTD